MYSITIFDNKYICECMVQDGTERWEESNEEAAVQSMIRAAKALNGTYIRKDDIQIKGHQRDWVHCVERKDLPTEGQKKLLKEIDSGHKVVLSYDDPRVKMRISPEECETIVALREGRYKLIKGLQ